jgi:ankyrin repeat protein
MELTKEQKELIKRVKHGDAAGVQAVLAQSPALIKTVEPNGTTLLHHAAWKGYAGVAQVLLAAGADVHATNDDAHYGGTPLHAAAHGNQKAVVELLIAAGADVKAVSGNGRTPLQETEIHKATAAAKLLKAAGA